MYHLQKHVDHFGGFWPWPSLMICLVTFSCRTSISDSTLGGLWLSCTGSPRAKAAPSVTTSLSASDPAGRASMSYKIWSTETIFLECIFRAVSRLSCRVTHLFLQFSVCNSLLGAIITCLAVPSGDCVYENLFHYNRIWSQYCYFPRPIHNYVNI